MGMLERIMKTYREGDSSTRIDLYMEHRNLRKAFEEMETVTKKPNSLLLFGAFDPFRRFTKRAQVILSACFSSKKT